MTLLAQDYLTAASQFPNIYFDLLCQLPSQRPPEEHEAGLKRSSSFRKLRAEKWSGSSWEPPRPSPPGSAQSCVWSRRKKQTALAAGLPRDLGLLGGPGLGGRLMGRMSELTHLGGETGLSCPHLKGLTAAFHLSQPW